MRSYTWFVLFSCLGLAACDGGGGAESNPTQAPTAVPAPNDVSAPVITLNGSPAVNHEQGTVYTDVGATAADGVDGTIMVITSGVVGSAPGSYTLTYSATDAAGNQSILTRTVVVVDTTPPALVLNGDATITLSQGTAYSEAGATASDTVDGDLSVEITGAVGTAPASYALTYTATDSAGNVTNVIRTVVVEAADSTPNDNDVIVFDNGAVGPLWNRGISAFDAAIGFAECNNDGGAGCPSISWQVASDSERGNVLEISHSDSGSFAGLFIGTAGIIDASDFSEGSVVFDVRVVSGDSKLTMKLDCVFPCTSGDQALGSRGATGWETVQMPFATLRAGGLDLNRVSTGIVIWATDTTSTVFRIDNVRFTGIAEGASPPTAPVDPEAVNFSLLHFGLGNVSDIVNPKSYRCVFDFGNFIFNAGIVLPAIDFCNTQTGKPTGTPTPVFPKLTGPALLAPTATHRWWGSVSFLGEMTVGDPNQAAYITPDPITARISNRGARLAGIPSGLTTVSDGFLYPIPDPFAEVFDGIAVGNSMFIELDAFLKNHSDGSVTVEWQSDGSAVMEATFVHGSPYVYFKTFQGDLVLRTLRSDGGEKGTFYREGSSLGIWTSVAGNFNNFLVTGEGATTFSNITSSEISVSNTAGELTVTLLPQSGSIAAESLTRFFETYARNKVASVEIDYTVDRSTNAVTINHSYLDQAGAAVTTLAGLQPLHWKHSSQVATIYQTRSARGTVKFAETNGFSYSIPYVGVLPALPSLSGAHDPSTLSNLVNSFIAQGPESWNDRTDTYFSGKNYGKVAELIAITTANGMEAEAAQLLTWLKAELEDWFRADTNGTLDINQYFVYDDNWNTLLGLEESFASHQALNDHHFHYGYFVRAAAEICRNDPAWCSEAQYGPMIELLIRDYAGARNDPMFPYLRNFDPANGFSWASGQVNFVRGNNNESTSEAANAYGAMVLYGLATGKNDIVERGMYLHASTAASYWEYWNNIDGFTNPGATEDNFPAAYNKIATSIIWGDGAVFATFFSGAFAQILGIQVLPSNALILHLQRYTDYLKDYVTLGLTESSNGKPSGLAAGQWPDIWWNLLAMSDADAAIADYNTVSDYTPEEGETKAHTYHWIHTLGHLGRVLTASGDLTADYPAALAFEKNGLTRYVVYNFSTEILRVTYSDGQIVDADPTGFTVVAN